MEEPGRLQSMGSLRVGHDWATSLSLFTSMHWRRNWQPTPVFLPGESQGRGILVGCRLWGRTESDTTEGTQQQSLQGIILSSFITSFIQSSAYFNNLRVEWVLNCSVTSDSATAWTVAYQAPLSMELWRQEYWSGLPFPFPGDLPNPGIKPESPALAGRFFTTEPPEKPWGFKYSLFN